MNRIDKIQMEILIKNHGSLEAAKKHIESVKALIKNAWKEASKTDMEPFETIGVDEKPFLVDPVSLEFHRIMSREKFKNGLINHSTEYVLKVHKKRNPGGQKGVKTKR